MSGPANPNGGDDSTVHNGQEMGPWAPRTRFCRPKRPKIAALRFWPYLAAYRDVLGAGLSAKSRAVLNLALSFFTWRTLVREGGLERVAAVGSWSKPSMAQTKHEAAVSLAP